MGIIFISYRSSDREFVLRLADDIVNAGGQIWLDVREISGRKPYWNEIQEGVESCSHFLFVISPESIAEDSGALTELYHAAGLKPIPTFVPVVVRSVSLKALPILISPGRYQIHDFAKQPYDLMLPHLLTALGLRQHTPAATVVKEKVVVRRSLVYAIVSLIAVVLLGGTLAIIANNNPRLTPTDIFTLTSVLSETSSTTPAVTIASSGRATASAASTLISPTIATIPTEVPATVASSGVNSSAIQVHRSADSMAICAAHNLDSTGLEVYLTSVNEHYVLNQEFSGIQPMVSDQCVCLQRVDPRYPLDNVCSDNNTKQVGNKIDDWRNTDVVITLNGTTLGTCKAQPERSDVYDCLLK